MCVCGGGDVLHQHKKVHLVNGFSMLQTVWMGIVKCSDVLECGSVVCVSVWGGGAAVCMWSGEEVGGWVYKFCFKA